MPPALSRTEEGGTAVRQADFAMISSAMLRGTGS
jgi:hypothetical protein